MKKLLIVFIVFLCALLSVAETSAQVYVVCTSRTVLGTTWDGKRIYGTRCSNPVPYDMRENIPDNCRWFQTLDQAYQWISQFCDR